MLFISYRRDDTAGRAGRLFDHLVEKFGRAQVFMDIESVRRGENFERALEEALARCDALLALIGPSWASLKREGRPRLEFDDDWVRKEIARSLRRGIPVTPVLLGNSKLPKREAIPSDLHPLLVKEYAEISDRRWKYDVGELVKDLLKVTSLALAPDDVASADTGIRLLKDLIRVEPGVADAMSRSREVIENTYRQLGRLDKFKTIHDALHMVEFECLRPMQRGGATGLRLFKNKFVVQAVRIRKALEGDLLEKGVRDDLCYDLDRAATAMDAVARTPGDAAAFSTALGELNVLLSDIPPQMDVGISHAASEVNLDRLVDLMGRVRGVFSEGSSSRDAELGPFVRGIDSLQRLRNELSRRVAEHTNLQRLDSKLRTVCVGGTPPERVTGEWARVQRERARIVPPFSDEFAAVEGDLATIESEVAAALDRGELRTALELMGEYFSEVSTVFRFVDSELKEFCLRLGAVNQPLRTILDML